MNVHPDLDALSASLDGEDEAARAHAQACAECSARVASLAAVRDAVARPVAPLAAGRREESLAAALAAFGGAAAVPEEQAVAETRSGGGGAPIVALPSRRWQWAAGSAVAAVLVLVVGMATLFGGGADREATDTASAPAAESDKAVSGGGGGGGGAQGFAAGDAAVADGGDLGEVASLEALRTRYGSRVLLAPGSAQSNAAPSSSTPTSAESRANSGAATATGGAGVPPPVQVGTRVCEIEARTARPQVGVVVYAATARFQGTPAVVLGFAPTAGSPPTVLLVLAPDQGCRLLGETVPS